MTKDRLTNEELTRAFTNNFELAKLGVSIAHNMISSGGEAPLGKLLDELRKRAKDQPKEDHEQ